MNAPYPMTPFKTAFLFLDSKLTGKPVEVCARQYHHYRNTFLDWFTKDHAIWYLSDSGYSRVGWDDESKRLFLTSNSTQQVKGRWEEALAERRALEAIINSEWDRLHRETDKSNT